LDKVSIEDVANCLDDLLDIMVAADRLDMDDLLHSVQDAILQHGHHPIFAANVKFVKKLAEQHHATGLYEYCKVFSKHKENFL
jgi:hypothetical protein